MRNVVTRLRLLFGESSAFWMNIWIMCPPMSFMFNCPKYGSSHFLIWLRTGGWVDAFSCGSALFFQMATNSENFAVRRPL